MPALPEPNPKVPECEPIGFGNQETRHPHGLPNRLRGCGRGNKCLRINQCHKLINKTRADMFKLAQAMIKVIIVIVGKGI